MQIKNHWLILILTLGLALRLVLANQSLWLDEAAQALESARPLSQQLNISQDFQPPLLHIFLHVIQKISRDEVWMRFFSSIVPGLASIFLIFLIAKEQFTRRSGVLAALLLSTSSFHIFYSQELRPYSLGALFALLSIYFTVKIVKSESNQAWAGFVISHILGLFTTYLHPFLLISQFLWLFFSRVEFKKILHSGLWILIVSFWWWPFFVDQFKTGQLLRQLLPGWEKVVGFDLPTSILLTWGKYVFGVLDLEINYFFISFSVLILLSILWLSYKNLSQKKVTFFFFSSLLPLFLALIVAIFVPIIQPKRILFLLPMFHLFVATIIDFNKRQKFLIYNFKFLISVFLVSCLLILNLYSTFSYYLNPKYQREDWRVISAIVRNTGPNTCVLSVFDEPFAPLRWYVADQKLLSTQVLYLENLNQLSFLDEETHECQHILSLEYLSELSDPQKLVDQKLISLNYIDRGIINVRGVGFVKHYQKND